MEFSLSNALVVAKDAAVRAGLILDEMLLTASVREKGPKDLVTDADIAAQKEIESVLLTAFPDHVFIGEESGLELGAHGLSDEATSSGETPWTWVVDPLDGTANYVHRLPNFAVSIALVRGDVVWLGVVYDPISRELFSAVRGEGAHLHGVPIHTSGCRRMEDAMVAVSFPPQVHRDSPEVEQFLNVLEQSQSIRRLGSAALNLCYVAAGRLDAYWANRLKPWDVAAGALIVEEAGAVLSNLCGEKTTIWRGEYLAVASIELQQLMIQALGT
jgi:myo-inositol-1(or 4)-monophosphatase